MSIRVRNRLATSSLAVALTLGAFVAISGSDVTAQQRNPLATIGKTVADTQSPSYRFERFTVSTADGSRTWRVHVAIPKKDAPEGGYPSLWLLDGNASLIEFDESLLAEIVSKPKPYALVFIGYDNELRIDSPARNRDYTPALSPEETEGTQPRMLTGGADAFLDIVERKIRPEVQRLVELDANDQTLWAHSLGGLFVLHALFNRPGSFQTYVSGSPSMWWGDGFAAKEAERFVAHNAGHEARIIIHLGGAERVGDRGVRDMNNPRVVAHLERIKAASPDAAMLLADRLKDVPGLTVSYREFEGLGHGPMFRASLMGALHDVIGVDDRSATPRPSAPE